VTRKNKSTDSLKLTKRASKQKKSTLAEDLIEGFKQAIAHNRGEIKLRTRQIYLFDDVDVKAVREKSGLSQTEFAFLYGFNPRTLQQWEQGRTKPDSAVRAYLAVIDRIPDAVTKALRG
jgi:putative transcriptional regulator